MKKTITILLAILMMASVFAQGAAEAQADSKTVDTLTSINPYIAVAHATFGPGIIYE